MLETDKILIADTLNNKIKCVEVDGTRSAYSKTFIGSGKRGNKLMASENEEVEKVNAEKNKNGDSEKYRELLLKNIELNSPQGVAYDR